MLGSPDSYDLFRLSCVRGVGPKRLRGILVQLRRAGWVLGDLFVADEMQLVRDLGLSEGVAQAVKSLDEDSCFRVYEELGARGVELVSFEDCAYPEHLQSRLGDRAPALLFSVGRTQLLNSDSIAVVGARNAGTAVTTAVGELAGGLADLGWNVVSGYAKGVDTSAHLGALRAGGTTTAVLSYGILEFSAKGIFAGFEWSGHAVAVSQFAPLSKWSAGQAMTRNATVMGLAGGVVVAQSGPERDERGRMSGTFAAAKSAMAIGVPVLVLSPSLVGGTAVGNSRLIELGGIELRGPDLAEEAVDAVKEQGHRDPLGQTSLDLG